MANHKADREVLNHLLKDYEHTMLEFEKYRSDILDYQSGVVLSTSQAMNLVNLPKVNPSEVYSDIQAIKTYWNGLVEADEEAKKEFNRVKNGVNELSGMITTFLESIGKNGANLESIDVNQLQTAIFGDKELLKTITNKMNEGENPGPAERELLYRYIQESLLNEEVFEHMDRISEIMEYVDAQQYDDDLLGDYDNDQMKEYINEEVLTTEASLAMEIFLLEMYLFAGNNRPSELRGTTEDRIKLNNYLTMLTNYQLLISEHREEYDWQRDLDEPLYARIENISFISMDDPINDHLESYIVFTYDPDQYSKSGISREEFLELENPAFSYHGISEVEYFYEPNPIENFKQREILDYQEEIDTYTGNFISNKLFEFALSLAPGNILTDIAREGILEYGKYEDGIRETEQKIIMKTLEQTASELHLELQINKSNIENGLEEMQVFLHPTDKTFDLIDRWKAVHLVDSDIAYPEIEIREHDWSGINYFLYNGENKASMTGDENGRLVFDYIFKGEQSNHPIVQEAVKIIEGE